MISLPIDPHLAEVTAKLQATANLILHASPGSGKTTRAPAALLDAGFAQGKQIWVLEPRRLAARLAATRVAQELGETPGETVGYHFRHEKVTSERTRLIFFTEGMLLRQLRGNPQLKQVAAVVLDEFHERHLQGDMALAVLRRLQLTSRPDLRLVVMSATLDTERLESFLAPVAQVKVEAARFPLQVFHHPPEKDAPLEQVAARAVRGVLDDPSLPTGDILVFLPGRADIRRVQDALAKIASDRRVELHTLYGELGAQEQTRAVTPSTRRKVILSTNVAESSVTIEGVQIVIDSGLHRVASHSHWSGMERLRTQPISKASATQRAGRAARTGPGVCIRLYAAGDLEHRAPFDPPEIQRADFAAPLLDLASLDALAVQWLDAPAASSLQAARTLLHRLGALDSPEENGVLTELGYFLATLPVHPRLGRILVAAERLGVLSTALELVAHLSEGRLNAVDVLQASSRTAPPERAVRLLGKAFKQSQARTHRAVDPAALAQAVLAGFPDRVAALAKSPRGSELRLSGGGSIKAPDLGALEPNALFVVVDATESQHQGQARANVRASALVGIEPEWLLELEPNSVRESKGCEWDSKRSCVIALEQLWYDALLLESRTVPLVADATSTAVLLKAALGLSPERVQGWDTAAWIEALLPVASREVLESVLARRALLDGSAGTPPLQESLWTAAQGLTSLAELKALDWERMLLPPGWERLVPSHVALPGGRRIAVQYALGRAPWIESRLQDFFGMAQGPAILGGKLPLTLHLLAPNYRAVQVTTDLTGFWKNTYPTVRRELSRNYPKHAWPDDPLHSQPPPPRSPRKR